MKKTMCLMICAAALSLCSSAQTVDVRSEGTPLTHHWSVGTCAGRANEGLRTSWVEQLRLVREQCGFRYLRMHDIFNDDMCVYSEDAKGRPVYNWQYVDEVYDRMLDLGVKPFVELSFFPEKLAAEGTKRQMWYRNCITYDPAKLDKWGALVKAFTEHVVERYGLAEVLTWYFEVWNEPNLNMNPKAGFFDGTRSDYFAIYKTSALAVKSVDERLRVGGPATSNFIADHRHDGEVLDNSKSVFYSQETINQQQWEGVWIKDFLTYCAKEGLPVDFISCHPYPTDYALDPVSGKGKDAVRYVYSIRDDISWLRSQIAGSSYPDAELHLTEWSTSPSSRDRMHDMLPPAAYIIKGNMECTGMTNSLMYWTFTDIFEEKGGGQEIFHGGFGMINFQGIVKPSFHAYRMLGQLGDVKLYYQDPLVVTRSSQTGRISAIAFNYPEEFTNAVPSSRDARTFMQATSKQLDLVLTGLTPGATVSIETLDHEHGYAYAEYEKMGRPHSPSRQQTEHLKRVAWDTKKETLQADSQGRLEIKRTLTPWACVLIKEL